MANVAHGNKLVSGTYPITPSHINTLDTTHLYMAISRGQEVVDILINLIQICQQNQNTWRAFTHTEIAQHFPNIGGKQTNEVIRDFIVKVKSRWYLSHLLISKMFSSCPFLDQSPDGRSRHHGHKDFVD